MKIKVRKITVNFAKSYRIPFFTSVSGRVLLLCVLFRVRKSGNSLFEIPKKLLHNWSFIRPFPKYSKDGKLFRRDTYGCLFQNIFSINRSSHQSCSIKNGVHRNFTKFTGKHLCQSLFFNKVTGLRCFPVNFVKFLGTPFLQNTSGRLLLYQLHRFGLKEKPHKPMIYRVNP